MSALQVIGILFKKIGGALKRKQTIRGRPASQPQSTLSCWKNFPPLIINSDPTKTWCQKIVLVIAFQVALTLYVKTIWFGCVLAVCIKKQHNRAIFGCSRFQKFNFHCFLHNLWLWSPKTENKLSLCVLYWLKTYIMILGT